MTERRRPHRRGRGTRAFGRSAADATEDNPYRDDAESTGAGGVTATEAPPPESTESRSRVEGGPTSGDATDAVNDGANGTTATNGADTGAPAPEDAGRDGRPERGPRPERPERPERRGRKERGGRGRRRRQRGRQGGGREGGAPQDRGPVAVTADTTVVGWLDVGRDGAFVRRHENSYLAAPNDPFVLSLIHI